MTKVCELLKAPVRVKGILRARIQKIKDWASNGAKFTSEVNSKLGREKL
jgi:hypothetical protein